MEKCDRSTHALNFSGFAVYDLTEDVGLRRLSENQSALSL